MLKRVSVSKKEKAEHKDVGVYKNFQRTLVFSTRGILHRDRHLMTDLRDLLPHSRKDSKFDLKGEFRRFAPCNDCFPCFHHSSSPDTPRSGPPAPTPADKLAEVNEIADLKDCNNVVFFEARKHKDLYMWVSRCPTGPSVKFLVQNIHTMSEIKLTGNCLKGSRPVLHFDAAFDEAPQSKLLREMLSQTFGSPKGHPKVKPFVDHVFSFFLVKGRVYFRNYQIAYEANKGTEKEGEPILVEIGPRFVLNPIKIFAGSFSGALLWENEAFVSPNVARAAGKRKFKDEFVDRIDAKRHREAVLKENPLKEDETFVDLFA